MAPFTASVVIIALVTVFGVALAWTTTTAKGPPLIYIFSDSMSDVGNNNYLLLSVAKCDYPWYGIDYEGGYPTGRFTNGRTIGDIMAAKFGVPPLPPFLSLYMTDDAVLGGVNFASGGAGLLDETGINFVEYLSFDNQISYFEETKNAMIAKIRRKAAEKVVNGSIFQIRLGTSNRTRQYAFPYVLLVGGGVVFSIMLLVSMCRGESAEERRAALAVEYRLARRSPAEPAPVEVELMRPVVSVAAAPVVAKKLGYFPYSAEGRRVSEKLVCAICLEVFEHGDECSEMPACQHLFHRDCIGVWMKTNSSCPLCRRVIVPGSERVSVADDMV